MTQDKQDTIEREVFVRGEKAFTTNVPKDLTDAEFDAYQGDVCDFIDALTEGKSASARGAMAYINIVRRFDPKCEKGHGLYYDGPVKDAKDYVKTVVGVKEAAVSMAFTELRENLDPNDPWFLPEDRPKRNQDKKGATKEVSFTATEKTEGDAQPVEDASIEALVAALTTRLRGLNPGKDLKKAATGFITDLEELADAARKAVATTSNYLRSGK